MKQKFLGILFLTAIFIFTAYYIGLNQSSRQLELLNEKLTILEQQMNNLPNENELEEKEQQVAELETQIKTLNDKIQQLESELSRLAVEKKPTKKVFLTFDDGPSPLTKDILAILNKKNVQATFFTIGTMMEQYPEIVKQTYENGHMVLPHSYSHNYSIYSTFDMFYKDLAKVETVYEDILGFKSPTIFRFPGGSSNPSSIKFGGKQFMPSLTSDLRARGYTYIDWNVISGDATKISKKPNKMLEQVIKGSQNNNFIVALFHDIAPNKATAQLLPEIIDYYQKQDYTFRTFRDVTSEEIEEMMKRGIANKTISY
ncbi:DUF2730 family protein [Anaerobacillus sp. CMMVII]|uniref:DUF2730 family protein n=1 Tax=Anaerobacillus sp. CMMVII TaxID=2755588 RepID=UPI0021B70050|nr:DUF2730 family protein [Anaerobacillus sp. CMMVII]MCT8138150.1 DUF2730 family protein [Anaerobacillus sp. CMMVII]